MRIAPRSGRWTCRCWTPIPPPDIIGRNRCYRSNEQKVSFEVGNKRLTLRRRRGMGPTSNLRNLTERVELPAKPVLTVQVCLEVASGKCIQFQSSRRRSYIFPFLNCASCGWSVGKERRKNMCLHLTPRPGPRRAFYTFWTDPDLHFSAVVQAMYSD